MSNPLTQSEADMLLKLPKYRTNDVEHEYPHLGGLVQIPLTSHQKVAFILDIWRSRINLSKDKYQNRFRQAIVLARLDIGGPPHRNPDGVEVPCPHLHLYREGFDMKWAYHIPNDVPNAFRDPTDAWQLLHDFMAYVNGLTPCLWTPIA